MIRARLVNKSFFKNSRLHLHWLARTFLIIIFNTGLTSVLNLATLPYSSAQGPPPSTAPPKSERVTHKLEHFNVSITSVRGKGEFYIVKAHGEVRLNHREIINIKHPNQNTKLKLKVIRYRNLYDDYLVKRMAIKSLRTPAFTTLPAQFEKGEYEAVRQKSTTIIDTPRVPIQIRLTGSIAFFSFNTPAGIVDSTHSEGGYLNSGIIVRASPIRSLKALEFDGEFNLGRLAFSYYNSNRELRSSRAWVTYGRLSYRYWFEIKRSGFEIAPETGGEIDRFGTDKGTGYRNFDANRLVLAARARYTPKFLNWASAGAAYGQSVWTQSIGSSSVTPITHSTEFIEFEGLIRVMDNLKLLMNLRERRFTTKFKDHSDTGSDRIRLINLGIEFEF